MLQEANFQPLPLLKPGRMGTGASELAGSFWKQQRPVGRGPPLAHCVQVEGIRCFGRTQGQGAERLEAEHPERTGCVCAPQTNFRNTRDSGGSGGSPA